MESQRVSPLSQIRPISRDHGLLEGDGCHRLRSPAMIITRSGIHASTESFQTLSAAIELDQQSSRTALLPTERQEPLAVGDTTFPARQTIISWSLEIFAVFVSIASMIATIVVLHSYDNRPLSAWTFFFTLNTIIATLGTLARTTLAFAISACIGQQKWSWFRRRSDTLVAFERFDEASRGPWGGTRLFVWLRFRHWAALGALVTVGTVAFDPFLQAVISTYGEVDNIATTQGASIGHALNVDAGTIVSFSKSGPIRFEETPFGFLRPDDNFNRPEFWVVSSIYNGLTNTTVNRSENTAFQCTTGNCTWSPYVSAAICSRCEDASNALTVSSGFGNDVSNVPNPTNMVMSDNYTTYSLPYCSIKNPHRSITKYASDWWSYTTHGGAGSARTLMTADSTYDPRQTINFRAMETLLMAFVMLRAPDEWLNGNVRWNETRPQATECALYLCAKAYNTTSQSNVLSDEALDSWTDRDPSSYKYSTHRNISGGEAEIEAWDAAQGNQLFEPKLDYEKHDLRLNIPAEASERWQIPTRSVNFTHRFIRTLSESLITIRGGQGGEVRSQKTNSTLMLFPDIHAPAIMDALWNSTNLTTTFDNVARSITNRMRDVSPDRQPGKTQTWVIYIRVKWAYLAYPLSMLAFGIAYVICTIVESMSLRMPAWKEKALPTLIYGLNDETQRLLREREWDEDKEKSKDISVRFKMDEKEGCMRLVAG